MNAPAIRVDGLWKEYVIGGREKAKTTFREALMDNLAAPLRRLRRAGQEALVENRFWALEDVSFEVQPGEVVGVIGRNGAGKSTLLKILSRITAPTKGRVEINGRIASLLEVGTGFHPELTGRENIRLNGAILGMSGAEIAKKFDEIVAFAEVDKFLDTPVKHYSSGMYVRLAFAVAAHLEPEILLVDEVLAVGDAEFQKKCLGKMNDVARHGRTVLFVSHNMAAVASLTRSAIVLHKGGVVFGGSTADAVKAYSAHAAAGTVAVTRGPLGRGRHATIRTARLLDADGVPTSQYAAGKPFKVEVEIETNGSRSLSCEVLIVDQAKAKIALGSLSHFEGSTLPTESGVYRLLMSFAPMHLAAGHYSLDVTTSMVNQNWDHYVEDAISFEVLFSNPAGLPWNFNQSYGYGAVALPFAKPTVIERVEAAIVAAQ